MSRTEWWGSTRSRVVTLCFTAVSIAYVDRYNLSTTILDMKEEKGDWDTGFQGILLSTFFYGYIFTNVAGGILSNRYGTTRVLGYAVLLWSMFTFLTPFAFSCTSRWILLLCRWAVGASQGVCFATVYQCLSVWTPKDERSRSIAFIQTGSFVGTIFAGWLSSLLLHTLGWRYVYFVSSSLGVLWFTIWINYATDSPLQHGTILEREKEHLRRVQRRIDHQSTETIPWSLFFRSRSVWALIVTHFASNWGVYIILTWLPTYVVSLSSSHAAGLADSIPWAVLSVTSLLSGIAADRLMKRGWKTTQVRRLMSGAGCFGPALTMLCLTQVSRVTSAIFMISASLALYSLSMGGYMSNHMDLSPKHAGVLQGISNTAGTISGMVGVPLTGYLLESTSSWNAVFLLCAVIYGFAGVIWISFCSGDALDTETLLLTKEEED